MFDIHQPIIGCYARAGSDNLARVLVFCILSARVHFYRLPEDMLDVDENGADAGCLYGWKFRAVEEVRRDAAIIYSDCEDIWFHAREPDVARTELVYRLSRLYGFGAAKAGFAAQLAYGVSGCLDTHNLVRFDISPRMFDNLSQRAPHSARAMIRRYHAVTDCLGGSQGLWDSWCSYVSYRATARYGTPRDVSALHCRVLGLPHK